MASSHFPDPPLTGLSLLPMACLHLTGLPQADPPLCHRVNTHSGAGGKVLAAAAAAPTMAPATNSSGTTNSSTSSSAATTHVGSAPLCHQAAVGGGSGGLSFGFVEAMEELLERLGDIGCGPSGTAQVGF